MACTVLRLSTTVVVDTSSMGRIRFSSPGGIKGTISRMFRFSVVGMASPFPIRDRAIAAVRFASGNVPGKHKKTPRESRGLVFVLEMHEFTNPRRFPARSKRNRHGSIGDAWFLD